LLCLFAVVDGFNQRALSSQAALQMSALLALPANYQDRGRLPGSWFLLRASSIAIGRIVLHQLSTHISTRDRAAFNQTLQRPATLGCHRTQPGPWRTARCAATITPLNGNY